MSPEELFLSNLGLIDRIVAFVCRRNHLKPDDAEEFASHVRLRLIENDYAILRKFEGRSTFSTYLTTVIQRLSFQYRVQMWGKWRPSAEAQRLGDKGVTLERLLTRDGYSFEEAVETLTTGREAAFTRPELEAIYVRLPRRIPRPVLVQETEAAQNVAAPGDAESGLMRHDREETARAAASALDSTIGEMEAEDQLILRMRFWSGRRVPEIASVLGLDAKKLYKHIERLLLALRKGLESRGIDAAAIGDVLQHGDVDFPPPRPDGAGNTEFGRSHKHEGTTGEEGRQSR